MKKIKSALISVYYKDGLERIVRKLAEDGVAIYSTGGTLSFIESLGLKATSVESLTGYPSILGGRVKTLHPKVFGGILARRDNPKDSEQAAQYEIPEIDAVIVCDTVSCDAVSTVQYCSPQGKFFTVSGADGDEALEYAISRIVETKLGRVCAHEGI